MRTKKILFFFLLAFFCSCGKEKSNKNIGSRANLPTFDTANATATYEQLKRLPAPTVDTIYTGLASYLTDERKFPLLFEHLNYYRKINGVTPLEEAVSALTKGFYYSHNRQRDSGNYFFKDAAARYLQLDMPTEEVVAYLELVGNYMFTGDYDSALACQYKALHVYDQRKDSAGIRMVTTQMLMVYTAQKEYTKTIELGLSNLAYYTKRHNVEMMSHIEGAISSAYYKLSEDQKCLDYAALALKHAKEWGNTLYISECLNNMALAYSGMGHWDKAAAAIRESLVMIEKIGDKDPIITSKFNLATALWKMGKKDSAMNMFDTLITETKQYGSKEGLVAIYKTLSVIHRDEKQYEKAYDYLKLYHKYKDSLYSRDKEQIINELHVKYETEKKQEQITQLNAEKKADRFKKISYLAALIFTIISATLAVLFLRNRNKKNELLVEKVQMELAANKRELRHFTESILLKNKFIQELELKLNNATEQAAANEENNEQLSELYQFKILTEDDWLEFKKLFDKVYPGLITRLRERYPDLSPAEERQFLLIKLNIENKECADMLGISIQSVKKNRYRLKKRFNLAETDNLDEFVKGFEVG